MTGGGERDSRPWTLLLDSCDNLGGVKHDSVKHVVTVWAGEKMPFSLGSQQLAGLIHSLNIYILHSMQT